MRELRVISQDVWATVLWSSMSMSNSKHVKSLSLKHVITMSISEIGEREAPLPVRVKSMSLASCAIVARFFRRAFLADHFLR